MEDRHSISEPRPVANPSCIEWEIDILRDDTVIVDTFVINNEVLPPRTNKKGKVLWRLPDTADKLPAFGTEDRRRILDVFKERKKKRKQEKKKRHENDHVPVTNGDNSDGKLSRNNSSHGYDEAGGGDKSNNKAAAETNSGICRNGSDFNGLSKQHDKVKDNNNGIAKQQSHYNQENNSANLEATNGYRRQQSCPMPSRPPPGLGDLSGGTNQSQLPDPSRIILDDAPEQNTQQHHAPTIVESPPPALSLIPALDARFIVVPKVERPDPLPGEALSSLAVPAARHFIASYYSYLENVSPSISIGDLARYYTTKAQKSVSIGGAHSVVQGRKDITTQIASLAGSSFLVRGVVAQDAYDGRGVHILITGTAKTVCNAIAGGVLAFAHSVSLCPIHAESINGSGQVSPELIHALESGFPFQIHNDALSFLSGDSIPPPPQQSPPRQQEQSHHPPPPPGLF